MDTLYGLIKIFLLSALISGIVYLILMPEHKKPKTYKEITLDHFLSVGK